MRSSPVASAVVVTLTPQGGGSIQINNGAAGQAAQVTIGANQNSAAFNLTGVNAGSGSLQATATGLTTGTAAVNVTPVVTSVNPASGAPGSTTTVNGRGFVQGASVRFGQTAATTVLVSATSLSATVPTNLTGTQNVTVAAGGQTSNSVTFSVTAATPSPVVFRSQFHHVRESRGNLHPERHPVAGRDGRGPLVQRDNTRTLVVKRRSDLQRQRCGADCGGLDDRRHALFRWRGSGGFHQSDHSRIGH
jgi:hypothetical protein